MAGKVKGSGLGARMAATPAPNAVAAGFAAATGTDLPETAPAPAPEAPAKVEAVALNIRLPKALHRTLRQIAFNEETSINALLIAAAEVMLKARE